MVRIRILSGARAGEQCRVNRFPCVIGREAGAGLVIAETGVWEKHLELDLNSAREFTVKSSADALLIVNGMACQEARLRNGDQIEIGSARLQFWLGETVQGSLRVREAVTWGGMALIPIAQVVLIDWLLK